MIDEELLRKIIAKLMSTGGRYADVFAERKTPTTIELEDGRIEHLISGTTEGVGLRLIFSGDRTAYAYTNDLGEKNLLEIAAQVASATREADSGRNLDMDFRRERPGALMKIEKRPDTIEMKRKISMLEDANRLARSRDQRIKQVTVIYRDAVQNIRIATSEGVLCDDERILSVGLVNVVAVRDDGVIQTGYEPIGGHAGYELFDEHSLAEVAETATSRALAMLSARRAPGGRMPVIISSEAGGTMIHEAIGHGLEADLAGQGLSWFSGRMGEMVASPLVTVLDDGTIEGKRGSSAFDDEGTPTSSTVLVEDGKLVNYMYDKLNALRDGVPSTGNGRRQSYEHRPIPRMTNTLIAAGKEDPAGILSSTERGLFVKKMGGGQVNTVTGDFVFDVTEGYLIENGQLGDLVRGATLTGNGPEVLKSIDRVGSDLGYSIGTCGKDAQGVPVSDAMPTVRIPDMVVGGEV